jgi:alpha-galactosidase
LTALCRSVGRTSKIKVVGLCNELIGFKFMMSLLFDVPLQKIDPVVAGVNHLPLITELRVAGDDGFAMLHSIIDGPAADREAPIWMSPPPGGVHWRRVSDGETWTKADVLANIRLKCELLRQFGVLPGSSDTHIAEFLPQFVTPTSDYGRDWGVRQYGIQTHQEDKWADEREVAEMLAGDEITPWPSGELAADLIDGVVTGKERTLPMNLPNHGQVGNLPDDAVVECMGIAGSQGVRPRDQATVPSVLGEYLREVSLAQELTVEAALTGDRTLVLEAMLTDQVARQLPYEHLVAMTDELLEATAPWLPQFSS